jgi:4-hydroxy-2-oxoheptanedioate aldolase
LDSFRAKLAEGRSLFICWVTIGSTGSAELVVAAGYDFVIIDTQHGAISSHDHLSVLQVIDAKGTSPLVRVGWTEPAQIMRALDLGATGVIVPMVSTPKQV